MKGADLKEFRIANNLTQTELGDYLGVQKGFISKIENGKDKLPEPKFRKLLQNPHGWDVSMLTQPEITAEEKPATNDSLIEYLQRKIESLEREKADLLQENAVLKYENKLLAPNKRESVSDADSSSSADAV